MNTGTLIATIPQVLCHGLDRRPEDGLRLRTGADAGDGRYRRRNGDPPAGGRQRSGYLAAAMVDLERADKRHDRNAGIGDSLIEVLQHFGMWMRHS